ncbi:MAG: DNA-3-methyladenine glycosylase [Burkholderiaceae bacterium]
MKPAWWDEAGCALAGRDPTLARVMRECGQAHLVRRGDPFQTLARSIVGQQISVAAAQAVWGRVVARARRVDADRLSRMRIATLRDCGLSARKAEYLKDLAGRFASGEVDPAHWAERTDDELIAELTRVRGVGRWTAEMLLIFNLHRPDVFPVDDVGLLRGIARNYTDGATPTRSEALAIGESWRPWRSLATWYMWRCLDPLPVENR